MKTQHSIADILNFNIETLHDKLNYDKVFSIIKLCVELNSIVDKVLEFEDIDQRMI